MVHDGGAFAGGGAEGVGGWEPGEGEDEDVGGKAMIVSMV
jgi:hypothetical protein